MAVEGSITKLIVFSLGHTVDIAGFDALALIIF